MKNKETKVEIQKINIKIGDTKIILSLNDAKKLHEVLSDMFNQKVVEHYHYYNWHHYVPQNQDPIITYGTGTDIDAKVNNTSISPLYSYSVRSIEDSTLEVIILENI